MSDEIDPAMKAKVMPLRDELFADIATAMEKYFSRMQAIQPPPPLPYGMAGVFQALAQAAAHSSHLVMLAMSPDKRVDWLCSNIGIIGRTIFRGAAAETGIQQEAVVSVDTRPATLPKARTSH